MIEHVADADVDVIALRERCRHNLPVRVASPVDPSAIGVPRGSYPYETHSVDGSTSRSSSRGVSSIMSSATVDAGQPGLRPSRRAIDAVHAVGGNHDRRFERRPSRASSDDAVAVVRRLHDVGAVDQFGAGLDARVERAARRTRRGESSAPPVRPTR